MNKTMLIFCFLSSVGFACAEGSHKGGHHQNGEEGKTHWQAPQEAANQKNPISADRQSIELGRKLYVELCSRCHGKNGLGDGPDAPSLSTKPTNLSAMSGGHTDGDFAWKIRIGRNDMPAWGEDLDDVEIWNVVNYIQSLATEEKTDHLPEHKASNHKGHTD